MNPLDKDDFLKTIKELERRILYLESRVIKNLSLTSGTFIIPRVTSDPASPSEGQIWENTTTHTFKIYLNGVVKTVTVT